MKLDVIAKFLRRASSSFAVVLEARFRHQMSRPRVELSAKIFRDGGTAYKLHDFYSV